MKWMMTSKAAIGALGLLACAYVEYRQKNYTEAGQRLAEALAILGIRHEQERAKRRKSEGSQ